MRRHGEMLYLTDLSKAVNVYSEKQPAAAASRVDDTSRAGGGCSVPVAPCLELPGSVRAATSPPIDLLSAPAAGVVPGVLGAGAKLQTGRGSEATTSPPIDLLSAPVAGAVPGVPGAGAKLQTERGSEVRKQVGDGRLVAGTRR